ERLDVGERRVETIEDLLLRVSGIGGLLLLLVLRRLGKLQVRWIRQLDLRLAIPQLDGAVHLDLPSRVQRVELVRRKAVEMLGLDEPGEAVEGGVEGKQARELRAVDAEHTPLDGDGLADVLLRLVPRNGGVGSPRGERDCQNQCECRVAHRLTGLRASFYSCAPRKSTDERLHWSTARSNARHETLLGRGPAARAHAPALPA